MSFIILLSWFLLATPPSHAATVDLGISLVGTPNPVNLGNAVTFSLSVQNFGPDTAGSTQVNFSGGSNFSVLSSSLASCAPTLGEVFCDLGNLSSGDELDFNITGNFLSEGIFTSTAVASIPGQTDSNEANNNATWQTSVHSPGGADLAAFITATPSPVIPGGMLNYGVRWDNSGPGSTSANGQVALDPEFNLLDFALLGTSPLDACSHDTTSNLLDCSLASIANGESVLLSITGRAPEGHFTSLTSAAFITGSMDPTTENNVALITTQISAVPIPPALWLFGTALVGLLGFSRRRKVA